MDFNKLTTQGNNFTVNNRVNYTPQVKLNNYISDVFEFAFGMTFGKTGHHRSNRSGGQNKRRNGELFINAFQGKLAEFGVWELSNTGVDVSNICISTSIKVYKIRITKAKKQSLPKGRLRFLAFVMLH